MNAPARTLPEGCYLRRTGIRVVAHVGTAQLERMMPADASDRALRAKQRELEGLIEAKKAKAAAKEQAAQERKTIEGSIRDLFDRYLPQIRNKPGYGAACGRANNWAAAYGNDFPVADLNPENIRTQITAWAAAPRPNPKFGVRKGERRKTFPPMAPETQRHHLKVLRKAIQFANEAAGILDDRSTNPARAVRMEQLDKPEDPLPRELEIPIVIAILRRVRVRSLARAVLCVMATTGAAQAEIKRLRLRDLDFRKNTVTFHARRKGGGSKARTIPFSRGARLALRMFVRGGFIGRQFSDSSVWKSFKLAADNAGYGEQCAAEEWTPYDLRHTFGTNLARAGKDQRAVQGALGHADIKTTDRYTLGAADERVSAALEAMNARPAAVQAPAAPADELAALRRQLEQLRRENDRLRQPEASRPRPRLVQTKAS